MSGEGRYCAILRAADDGSGNVDDMDFAVVANEAKATDIELSTDYRIIETWFDGSICR